MALKALLLLGTPLLLILCLSHTVQTTEIAQKNAFHFIEQLEGSQKGQHIAEISELKKYLKNFGYLDLHHSENDEFDGALESAIKAYQLNFRLETTGKMDQSTVKQMMKPRCGVADSPNIKRIEQSPAAGTHLTYKFLSRDRTSGADQRMKSIIARAFKRWEEVSHFTFEEVPEASGAAIEIGFLRGDHGDGHPFDGPGGVYGHVNGVVTGGKSAEIHLDADENWGVDGGSEAEMDVEFATVHEIGHILGLEHQPQNPDSFMHPCLDLTT